RLLTVSHRLRTDDCTTSMTFSSSARLTSSAPLDVDLDLPAMISPIDVSNLNDLIQFGTLRLELVTIGDDALEGVARLLLAVYENHARPGGRHGIKPAHQIALSGVPAEAAHRADRRFDRNLLPLDGDELLAVHQRPAERAFRLESGDQDRCFRLRQIVLEMMH